MKYVKSQEPTTIPSAISKIILGKSRTVGYFGNLGASYLDTDDCEEVKMSCPVRQSVYMITSTGYQQLKTS